MTSVNFQQWIQHPETLNRDTLYELRNLLARYPYFQSLRLLYLKNLYILHDISFGGELRKAVLYIADRRQLFRLIEGDRYALHPHASAHIVGKELEKEPSIDRTLSLIDAFLATVPEEHSQTTELDYAMDYTAYLIRDDEETNETDSSSTSETEEGISLKLPKEDNPLLLPLIEEETDEAEEEKVVVADETPRSAVEETEQDDSCFTETLAKIYIKQRRYDKALEIIKKLSLNYPKKNAYFADQIRFLEKLIINAKSK